MSAIIKSMLLDGLDEAFDKKSWHGPNLRGAIRGVTGCKQNGVRRGIVTMSGS